MKANSGRDTEAASRRALPNLVSRRSRCRRNACTTTKPPNAGATRKPLAMFDIDLPVATARTMTPIGNALSAQFDSQVPCSAPTTKNGMPSASGGHRSQSVGSRVGCARGAALNSRIGTHTNAPVAVSKFDAQMADRSSDGIDASTASNWDGLSPATDASGSVFFGRPHTAPNACADDIPDQTEVLNRAASVPMPDIGHRACREDLRKAVIGRIAAEHRQVIPWLKTPASPSSNVCPRPQSSLKKAKEAANFRSSHQTPITIGLANFTPSDRWQCSQQYVLDIGPAPLAEQRNTFPLHDTCSNQLVAKLSENNFRNPLLAFGRTRKLILEKRIKEEGIKKMKELTALAIHLDATLDNAKDWFKDDEGAQDVWGSEGMMRMEEVARAKLGMARTRTSEWEAADEDPDEESPNDDSSASSVEKPVPTHLRVSGAGYNMANGIYTKMLDDESCGLPVWSKWGTAFCFLWHNSDNPGALSPSRSPANGSRCSRASSVQTNASILQERPMSAASTRSSTRSPRKSVTWSPRRSVTSVRSSTRSPTKPLGNSDLDVSAWHDWEGWLLCTHDEQRLILARRVLQPNAQAEQASPAEVVAWETHDGEGWVTNSEFVVEAMGPPMPTTHIFHSNGFLGGTFKLGDDVHGRTSYIREDGLVTISWDSADHQWIVWTSEKQRPEDAHDLQVARQADRTNEMDPTSVSAWECWNAAANDWIRDESISVHRGAAPADQIYLSFCCVEKANGVYSLCPRLHNSHAEYVKTSPFCTSFVRWDCSTKAWVIEFTLQSNADEGSLKRMARCYDDKQIPTDAKGWEQNAQVALEETAIHRGEVWSSAPLKLSNVPMAPKELFLDIQQESKLFIARGVYTKTRRNVEGRCSYKKTLGEWFIMWNPTDESWTIKYIEPDPSSKLKFACSLASARGDVPDPSLISSVGATWRCWVNGAWEPDPEIKVTTATVPPRRLYVKGKCQQGDAELQGVYFLRGHHKGRVNYTKESLVVQDGETIPGHKRGRIAWGGETQPYWSVTCTPIEGSPVVAILRDDLPWPTMATSATWETERQITAPAPSNRPSFSLPTMTASQNPLEKLKAQLSDKTKSRGSVMKRGSSLRRGSASIDLHRQVVKEGTLNMGHSFEEFSRQTVLGGGLDPQLGDGVLSGLKKAQMNRRGSFEAVSDSSEQDSEEEEEEDEVRDDEFQCISAEDSPNGIFFSGYSAEVDGTYWLRVDLHDGRSYWETECQDCRIWWSSIRQVWQVCRLGESYANPWAEVACASGDTPDPTMISKGSWKEFTTPSKASSLASVELDHQISSGTAGTSYTILEKDDEDADSNSEENTNPDEDRQQADKQWRTLTRIICIVVPAPPVKIFVTGSATNVDFTGIFSLLPDSIDERRPAYKAERVGTATPCEIRYAENLKRWVIERIPALGSSGRRLSRINSGTKYMLAGVEYDAPNPVLVRAPWDVRVGDKWVQEDRIRCREVCEPPTEVCIFGALPKYDSVAGTYKLYSNNRGERPVYRCESINGSLLVKYQKEVQRWIIIEESSTSKRGMYFIKCNVPNPVETLHMAWMSYDESTRARLEEETLGCYAGSLPPKQVYCFGGHRGLSGVYTILYRNPHAGRIAYKKGTSNWHIWWNESPKQWMIGNVPAKQGLDYAKDKIRAKHIAEAWCRTDVSQPHTCPSWHYKGRNFREGGVIDSNGGVITCADTAEALGDVAVQCVKVEDPPDVVLLKRSDGENTMRGIYFLHPELKSGRCAYVKQCNIRKSENWVILYQAKSAKWMVDRSGFQMLGRPQAYVTCDCPDPTLVIGRWMARSGTSDYERSKGLQVETLPPSPTRVFVFGAVARDEENEFAMRTLPFNGMYSIQEDCHNRRPLYRKDYDTQYVIRFFEYEQRWIIDSRQPEADQPPILDDNRGLCSASFDCWHPAAAEVPWAMWHEAPKKGARKLKIQKTSNVADGDDAEQGKLSMKALWNKGLKAIATVTSMRSTRNSITSDDVLSSGGGSCGGTSQGRLSFSARSMVSRKSAGGKSHVSFATSHKGKQASWCAASSVRSGKTAGSAYSDDLGEIDKGQDKNLPSHNAWVATRTISVVPVGPEPTRLYLVDVDPSELEGIYDMAGHHCGRPAYRLVDANGEFKTSSSSAHFNFSPFGYALRWHPGTTQWILGEYSKIVEVKYEYGGPAYDIVLEGDLGGPIRVAEVRERGIAAKAGIDVGSRLISLNGDLTMFVYQDPARMLKDVPKGSVLCFRQPGFDTGSDGHCFLPYDAPYPSSIQTTWLRVLEGAGLDGVDAFVPTDTMVECRSVERPPECVCVQGHRGKPKDINGVYDLEDHLVNGRPEYVNHDRWAITWDGFKKRWKLHQPSTGAVFAYALCFAPHPATTTDHGGVWMIPRDSNKRGFEIVPDGAPISLQDFTEIFTNTLQAALKETQNIKNIQRGVIGGRARFNIDIIERHLDTFKVLFKEAVVYGISQEQCMQEAWDTQSMLAGYLNIEALMQQAEESNASRASWMEALTEMRARLSQDRADTAACFDDGWTAAHIIARYGINEAWTFDALSELKRHGADIEAPNNLGMTPLLLAISSGRFDTVRVFLRLASYRAETLRLYHGERSEEEDELMAATDANNVSVLKTLIFTQGQRNLSAHDEEGQGIVHHLVLNCSAAGLEAALKMNALDANAQDHNGDTALHLAVRLNQHVSAFVLLKCGACPIICNSHGQTPYMLALELGVTECIQECEKSMLTWSEIEEMIGRVRHNDVESSNGDWRDLVRKKVQMLLQVGFGDTLADALHPTLCDKLQFLNHLFVLNPELEHQHQLESKQGVDARQATEGASKLWCLENRGVLLARELLVPLLQLTGEVGLDLGDHIKYANFTRYLLKCGVGAFGGISSEKAVGDSIDGLKEKFSMAFELLHEDMRHVTDRAFELVGQAAETPNAPGWPALHHHFAHGALEWLSANGAKQNLLLSLGALVDVDAFTNIEDMCRDILPAKSEFERVNSPRLLHNIMISYWSSVYARWLVHAAKKLSQHVYTRFFGEWGTRFRMQNGMTLATAQTKKIEYFTECDRIFPQDSADGTAAEGITRQATPRQSVAIKGHPVAAGGIVDMLSCSLVLSDTEALQEAFDDFKRMTLDKDGMELVAVKNEFWDDSQSDECRSIHLTVIATGPECPRLLVEFSLLLKRYDTLWRHREVLEDIQFGDYTQTNNTLRSFFNAPPKCQFVGRISRFGRNFDHIFEWLSIVNLERRGYLDLPMDAQILKDEKAFGFKRPDTRTNMQPDWMSDPSAPKAEGSWVQVFSDGTLGKDSAFEHVVDKEEHPPINKPSFLEHLQSAWPQTAWDSMPHSTEVEDCARDLRECHARLCFNPENVLTLVKDYMVLHVLAPGGEKVLIRNTPPSGYVHGFRKTHECFSAATRRILLEQMPSDLHDFLDIRRFNYMDGSWVVPDPKANSIPVVNRHFVMQVDINENCDAFTLLHAGLTIDSRV